MKNRLLVHKERGKRGDPLIGEFNLPLVLDGGLTFGGWAGVNGGGYLQKFRHCVIEEAFIAFAKIAFPPKAFLVKRRSVFHTAGTTDVKVSAEKTFVAKILLGACKFSFFGTGGNFLHRRFKYIAQPPFRLDKKIAGEAIAGVLDDDVLTALLAKGADCMLAGNTVRQYRVKVANAQILWAVVVPAVKYSAHKFAVLLRRN